MVSRRPQGDRIRTAEGRRQIVGIRNRSIHSFLSPPFLDERPKLCDFTRKRFALFELADREFCANGNVDDSESELGDCPDEDNH